MPPFILLILSVLLGAAAQVMLKLGVNLGGAGTSYGAFLSLLTSPFVLSGIFSFGLSFLLWLKVLALYDLAYAYPFVSLSYIIVALAARLLLGESIPPLRLAGLALIFLGIILVGRS
ncbi:EamA family transporter [Thermanaeromonas sp. C210]|uniref:EamA family transporter n=1 Tax=Thermanaeromonas sp. C210 TaxID=2731925 RepID=UPI00155BC1E4|nr:EamA family transporter [Thermanaeromonas sp. C210]GFN23151.1 transporter [Thermanaeromonas sp. C210]